MLCVTGCVDNEKKRPLLDEQIMSPVCIVVDKLSDGTL